MKIDMYIVLKYFNMSPKTLAAVGGGGKTRSIVGFEPICARLNLYNKPEEVNYA